MQFIIKQEVQILERASRCPKNDDGDSTAKKLGRPYDSAQTFKKVILYLEQNDEEQITINDLIQKMGEYLNGTGSTAYGFTHMKDQIKKQLAEKNIIAEMNGVLHEPSYMTSMLTPDRKALS